MATQVFALLVNNVTQPSVVAFGGDYVFSQMASAYGTIALQVLGPDGSTYMTLVSKTASDSSSGTLVTLGAGSVVRVTASGTTGAYATLARAPT